MIWIKLCLLFFLAIIIAVPAMTPRTEGSSCSVGGCGGGGESWTASAQAFMDSDVPLVGESGNQNTNSLSAGSFQAGQPVAGAAKKIVNSTVPSAVPSTVSSINGVYVATVSRTDSFPVPSMLKSLDAISEKDVVLDVSSRRSPGQAHIRGGVNIPAKSFFYENGTLRNITDLVGILGKAGISQEDAVMVYSDSF